MCTGFPKGQVPATAAGRRMHRVDATNRWIAVVDDERSMCRALQRLLRVAGFTVDTFLSGEDFLDSLAKSTPACVILDLQMPGLTGFDVLERLAASGSAVPTVVITGHDSWQARERALVGGAMDYLRKPIGEEELITAIGHCLDAKPANGRA